MSNIKITVAPVPPKAPVDNRMRAGNFYRSKDDGQLVFASHRHCPNGGLIETEAGMPSSLTPVVAIGDALNGYSLRAYFAGLEDYEEVDVEILVKPKA